MIFRQAQKNDLKSIVDLGYLLAMHEKKADPSLKISSPARKKLKRKYSGQIGKRDNMFFVAEDNDEIIGFLYGNIEKAPVYLSPHHKKIGNISSVFVINKYRKRGIGKGLVSMFLSWTRKRKVRFVQLGVLVKNQSSHNTWKGLGFKDYYVKMRIIL